MDVMILLFNLYKMQQINLYHALPSSFAQPTATTSPRVIWISSSAYFFKINFDSAVFKDINAAGLGVVVRDHRALVRNSFYSWKDLSPTIFRWCWSYMVAVKAITFVHELGISSIIIEGRLLSYHQSLEEWSWVPASFGSYFLM